MTFLFSDKTIGQGLYLKASVIDHSCYPNASWTSNGKELIIRAIDDVNNFNDIRFTKDIKDMFQEFFIMHLIFSGYLT